MVVSDVLVDTVLLFRTIVCAKNMKKILFCKKISLLLLCVEKIKGQFKEKVTLFTLFC